MLPRRAAAGHASRLDSLPMAVDLKEFRVQGDGSLRINEVRHPPRMTWSPSRHVDRVDETLRALVAMGGAYNLGNKLNVDPNEEAHPERAYTSRLKYLQDEAVHDGYVMNPTSEVDFWQFVRSAPAIRRGNLVLMDNGNLRAIWKDEQGTRLGLQFLGDGMVQFVIFKRRKRGQPTSRVSGRDSLEGLKWVIATYELYSLLYT